MLTVSVDDYTIAVKIVDDFDKLTSIYGFYRPTAYAIILPYVINIVNNELRHI
jgi:hypothetical protein